MNSFATTSVGSARWWQPARFAAALSIVLGAAVFVTRGAAAWKAAHTAPGTAVTSGCEQESIYSVWRVVTAQPLYTDRTRIPYSAAYFNWLFYEGYATPLRPVVARHGAAAVLAGSRLLTAAIALGGVLILLALFRSISPGHAVFGCAIAAWTFFGPLVGWWAHTCRPDVAAVVLEAAGLVTLLLVRRKRPWTAAALAALLLAAAWSCKQTFVGGAGAAALFLIVRRQPGQAALFVTLTALVWGATWLCLGPLYRSMQAATVGASEFYPMVGLHNVAAAAVKSAPLGVLAFGGVLAARRRPAREIGLAADALLLSAIGLAVSLPLCLVSSSKIGASTNYFLTPALLLAIAGLAAAELWPSARTQLATALVAIALHLAVLTGVAGEINLTRQSAEIAERWALFRQLPEPRFSEDTRIELPWLNPRSPAFVLAYHYDDDRRRGVRFEAGGIGGLVESRYFAALLVPVDTSDRYRGGALNGYEPRDSAAGMRVYVRRSSERAVVGRTDGAFLSRDPKQRGPLIVP